MQPTSWPSQVIARKVVPGEVSLLGHVYFEGGLVVGVLGAEGGHPHRAGVAAQLASHRRGCGHVTGRVA
jgi:hypothetical protein